MQAHGQEEMFMGFAADAPRWTQQPSSDFPSTRDSVQKQVMLNALWIITFIFTLLDRVLEAGSHKRLFH